MNSILSMCVAVMQCEAAAVDDDPNMLRHLWNRIEPQPLWNETNRIVNVNITIDETLELGLQLFMLAIVAVLHVALLCAIKEHWF